MGHDEGKEGIERLFIVGPEMGEVGKEQDGSKEGRKEERKRVQRKGKRGGC